MIGPAPRRLFALLISVSLLAAAVPAAAVDGDVFVALTNQKRASQGLAPVAWQAAVDQVTIERANHMARYDDFTHDIEYVVDRLKQMGVCFTRWGEIIAYEGGSGYDPADSIERWWNSSTHRAIMLGDYNAASGSHARSTSTGRTYAVMVFIKMCTAPAVSDVSIERLAGSDRYATAAAISRARFSSASTVFIATGASFPDALAASPAAARSNGPILLTARDSLPAATATELQRLDPSTIIVLGGTSAVSQYVLDRLRSYAGTVLRWAGADRYETAAEISTNSFERNVAVAFVATGENFPDALSGGTLSGRLGGPILLVRSNSVPAATADALAELRPGRIVILGSAGVVSEGVKSSLEGYTSGEVSRLAGSDRYATSVEVSLASYGSAGSDAAFVATGQNFPDGLAGGPVAALVPGPLLLVASNSLPSVVAEELARLDPDTVYVLGGPSAVSDGVTHAIRAALP